MDSCGSRVLSVTITTAVLCCFAVLLMTTLTQVHATGTPHIRNKGETVKVSVGQTVLLPCLVEGDPMPMIEWYKDQVPVKSTWNRYRTNHRGLKIKDVETHDSGNYVCRAVNGFGVAEISPVLIVTVADELYEPEPDHHHLEEIEGNMYPEEKEPKPASGSKPVLKKMTGRNQGLVQRPRGSNLSLRCVAEGHPVPEMQWLKDNQPLPSDGGGGSQGAAAGGHSPLHRGRVALTLHNLQPEDKGSYTCLATNSLGATNATFVLEVIDRLSNKPEVTGPHPLNTTVELGGIASFQCRVRSEVPPHIQWLKRDVNGTLQVRNERYRVLKPNEMVVLSPTQGIYLNKLVISPATADDTGKYVCLGTNSIGYNFRSAYLNVVANPKRHPVDVAKTPDSLDRFPTTFSVVIPVALALVFVTVSLICFTRRRRKRTPTHHPHGSSCVPLQRPQATTFGADERSRLPPDKSSFLLGHPPLPPPPVSERSSSQCSDGSRSHSGLTTFSRPHPQGHMLLYNC